LQKELIPLAEGLVKLEHKDAAVLDRLAVVLDRLHLDVPLASVLDTLFNLHFEAREFSEAAEALERVITVDPYNPLSTEKLERLEGNLDASALRELANRLGVNLRASDSPPAAAADSSDLGEVAKGADGGSNPLKDLMLQAEIFLQYGMEEKARERLGRIGKLFPGEEQKNEELQGLLARAGFSSVGAAPLQAPATPAETRDFRADLKEVSEISRNLSRQGTVKSVLFAAVNDIGRFWQVSRCVVGLATPNRPPSMALEYISPGMLPSEPAKLSKLVMGLQQALAGKNAPLVAESVAESPALAGLQDTLSALQVDSLVAIPLRDAEQEMGILLVEQCGEARKWKGNDLAGLEALAEQVVMAVSNVRLRNLMKALAVTDERSGLLHRESYLTCLLSEAERMSTQKTPLSAALLEFSSQEAAGAAGLPRKEKGKDAGDLVERFSPTVTSHLRQNDMAVRYGANTLALILPGAFAKDAAGATEKMRKLIHSAAMQANQEAPQVSIGVAEAIREGGMDSTDRITELINRLEWALDAARQAGPDAVKLLEPPALPQ
jgi:diguanylate cyclase (GGDEF)-like protein